MTETPKPDDALVERLRQIAAQIDPCMVGGRDAKLLSQAANRIEALSRHREGDDLLPIARRGSQAMQAMLTGISVHNSLSPDAPARMDDIAGPVVSELANAAHALRAHLSEQDHAG